MTLAIRILRSACAAFAAIALAQSVHAASYTWDNSGTGTWNTTGTNWNPAGAVWDGSVSHFGFFTTDGATAVVSGSVNMGAADGRLYIRGNTTITGANGGTLTAKAVYLDTAGKTLHLGSTQNPVTLEMTQPGASLGAIQINDGATIRNIGTGGLILNGTINHNGGLVYAETQTSEFSLGSSSAVTYNLTSGTVEYRSTDVRWRNGARGSSATLNLDGNSAVMKGGLGTTGAGMGFGEYNGTSANTLRVSEGEVQVSSISLNGAGTGTKSLDVYLGKDGYAASRTATLRPFGSNSLVISSTVPANSFNITLAGPNGIINSNDKDDVSRVVNVYSAITEDSAGRDLTFAGDGVTLLQNANTYTGETTITGGRVVITETVAAGSKSSTFLAGQTTITLNNTTGLVPGQGFTAIGLAAGTFITAISGNTVTLSQPTVSNQTNRSIVHTALVQSSLSSSSVLNVAAGATFDAEAKTAASTISFSGLRGAGTLIAPGSGGFATSSVAPGDGAIGTLQIAGGLTLANMAVYNFEADGTSSSPLFDSINVSGALTLGNGNNYTLNIANLAGAALSPAGIKFVLFDAGSAITDIGSWTVNLPSGWSNGSVQIDELDNTRLIVLAVPEPSAFAMLLGGMGILMLFRRLR
jgi:autotransporter-associated beta strand protein